MGIDLNAETAAEGITPVRLDVVRGDFTQPAVDLLPLGELLWRRNDDSETWEMQEALGYQHYRPDRRMDVFGRERMPNQAADTLPEHEEQMGLPDGCEPLGTTIQERRDSLAAKWRAHAMTGGEHFASVGEALGYVVRLQSAYQPFLAGHSTAGDAIQRWPYWWGIRTTSGARDGELSCRYDDISRLWAAYFYDFHDWIDWEETGSSGDDLHGVATNGEAWLVIGDADSVLGTGDFGANYLLLSTGVPAGIDWQSIAYGDDRFVACGADRVMVASSPDSWTAQTFGTLWRGVNYGEDVTEHGDRFMLTGDGGDLRTSTDKGLTWVAQTTGVSDDLYDSAFHAGVWITVGENGAILRSVDGGQTWVPQSSGVSDDLHCVVWGTLNKAEGTGLWVAGGNAGQILTSPDGKVWSLQTTASGLAIWGAAHSVVGGFCLVGHSAKFWTSPNGLAFVENTAPGAPDILRGVTTDDQGRWWACGLSGKMIKIETDHWWRLTRP